jgi:hypothetical protein
MSGNADLSGRFVLSADSPYLKNLAALWVVDPGLARVVEGLGDDDDMPIPALTDYAMGAGEGMAPTVGKGLRRSASRAAKRLVVSQSKTGVPTASVATAEGRIVALHSKYDPAAEARKLIDQVKIANCVAFYLLGLGLGYHLEELFGRAGAEAIFFVFEPDIELIRVAMEQLDLSAIISSGRLHIFTRADKSELFNKLTPQAAMCSLGFEGVLHGPSLALHPEFYSEVQIWIAEFAAFARTSLNTLVINGRRTAENVTANLADYVATSSIDDLKGCYAGKPAIIVSAGPSLRKNKHHLHDASGRAVFIAVQTILQPLIEMGIEPQFVTSLDYHDISTRYYDRLPANLRTHLVAEPKASPKIFDLFPGPLTVLGNDFADRLLREFSKELGKGRLQSGATVAHLAYYLAEHLGCDPIIFVGQDLGFSDGLAYSPGTNIEDMWRPELNRFCTLEMKQWEFIARDRPILRRISDFEDKPMYTEERLYTYLQQFERDFLHTKTRVIDATEGGAKKRGAIAMKLADAIREFCVSPLPEMKAPEAHQRQAKDYAARCLVSLEARVGEAREIESISQETLPLLEEIRDSLEDQARVNRAIARIDTLRKRIDAFGATYDLVTQLTQKSELQRFQRDRRIAAGKLTGLEKQREQIERDIENVRAVEEAARSFQKMMREAIDRLGGSVGGSIPAREAA